MLPVRHIVSLLTGIAILAIFSCRTAAPIASEPLVSPAAPPAAESTPTAEPSSIVPQLSEPLGCPDGAEVVDESASFVFKNANEIRQFVESSGVFTPLPKGASGEPAGLRNDLNTATKVCEIRGFKRVLSIGHSRSKDCENQLIVYWDAATNSFAALKACRHNSYIEHLICRGQVKRQCDPTTDAEKSDPF